MKFTRVAAILLAVVTCNGINSHSVFAFEKEVFELQACLKAKGYDPGNVDGSYSGKTKKALEHFLKDGGHSVTRRLAPEVKNRLCDGVDFKNYKVEIRGKLFGILDPSDGKMRFYLEVGNDVYDLRFSSASQSVGNKDGAFSVGELGELYDVLGTIGPRSFITKAVGTINVLRTTYVKPEGLVKNYYGSGKLMNEGNYKNGKKEGPFKDYYENGKLKQETNFKNGKVEGFAKIYYESGKLKIEANFKNGKQEGPSKKYDENGELIEE